MRGEEANIQSAPNVSSSLRDAFEKSTILPIDNCGAAENAPSMIRYRRRAVARYWMRRGHTTLGNFLTNLDVAFLNTIQRVA